MTTAHTQHEDNQPARRRDRPGDLGRRASVLTWAGLGLGMLGLYLVREIHRQPLPTLSSLLFIGVLGVLALVIALTVLKPDMAAHKNKRPGLVMTAILFAAMTGFAAYSLSYWWIDTHGSAVEITYQLVAKDSTGLDWEPVVGKAPPIRLNHPEPLFMTLGIGSQYPFPLLKGPMGFWVLDTDPDAAAAAE